MKPTTVVDLLNDELIPKSTTRATGLDGIKQWLDGDNPVERAAHQDPNRPKAQLADLSRTPMLRQIVEQLAQQLVLESVSAGSDDAARARLWSPWESNGLPTRQGALYEAAIGYGYAYGLVVPGESPDGRQRLLEPDMARAAIRFLSPRSLYVVESSDPFEEWPLYGLWTIPQEGKRPLYRLIEAEGQHFLSHGDDGRLRYIEFRRWEMGVCPIVTYSNHLTLDGQTMGEVERNETVARRYDKTVHDRLLIQHNNSWRVKTATGLEDPGSPEDKDRLKAQLRHDDVLTGGPDVSFGSLPETTLDSTLKAAEADQETLSAMAQVTIWSLNSSKMVNLSADAIAEARSLNRMKVQALQRSFGRSHANLIRLASHVEGREDDAANFNLTMEWENVEAQALSGIADAISKLDKLGVPREALWEMIPGISRRKVEEWKRWAKENPTREALLAAALTRQTEATV